MKDVIGECSSLWCQSPDGAGKYDCWAGWEGEKCLCSAYGAYNNVKTGVPDFQTYPKMMGNTKERTGRSLY